MPNANNLTGTDLELAGKRVLQRIGLTCHTGLAHAKLLDINPQGQYSSNDTCEFDYVLPAGEYALLGEITSRSDPAHAQQKHRKFRRAFDAVREARPSKHLWRVLGVREEDLPAFRNVRQVRGFFVATSLTDFDVVLPVVKRIAVFFRPDWDVVSEYAQILGPYARTSFLHALDVVPSSGYRPIKPVVSVSRDKKIVSGTAPTATLYTFEVDPYDLLDIARVYRRDALPDLVDVGAANKYQRPLVVDKLRKIRKSLLHDPDFIFPSAILGVLAADCTYDQARRTLELPDRYGAISIIDGQHRLFSYADEDLHREVGDRARILVTAIHFDESEEVDIRRLSARTFVEINTNQTTVPRSHLDAIAYEVLGQTDARSLAAAVILRVNSRRGGPLFGFFQTNQTALGMVSTTTIIGTLKGLVDMEAIARVRNAQWGKPLRSYQGYTNLFGSDILDATTPETLVVTTTAVVERYFGLIARLFRQDWPSERRRKNSCFENAKFVAAWIRLLKEHVARGYDWEDVEASITAIRTNLLLLNGLTTYTRKVFELTNPHVPTARYAERDAFRFLVANEDRPTSITQLVVYPM